MTLIQAVQGVFTSPALEAAALGMAASFALCVLLVLTKRWHGALTMDHMEGSLLNWDAEQYRQLLN